MIVISGHVQIAYHFVAASDKQELGNGQMSSVDTKSVFQTHLPHELAYNSYSSC